MGARHGLTPNLRPRSQTTPHRRARPATPARHVDKTYSQLDVGANACFSVRCRPRRQQHPTKSDRIDRLGLYALTRIEVATGLQSTLATPILDAAAAAALFTFGGRKARTSRGSGSWLGCLVLASVMSH